MQECKKHLFEPTILNIPKSLRSRVKGGGYDKMTISVPHLEIYCVRCGEHRSFEVTDRKYDLSGLDN